MLHINVRQVRELKGASLAVLVLLAQAPQPVNKAWLARSSGYSDKPVKAACDYLLEQGLIDNCPTGWRLAAESQKPPEEHELEDDEVETRNNSDPQEDFEAWGEYENPNNSAELGFSHIWSKPPARKNSVSRDDYEHRSTSGIRKNSVSQVVFLSPAGPGTRNNSAEVGFSHSWNQSQTRKNSAELGFSHTWNMPQPRKNRKKLASLKILSLKDLKELKDLKDFKDLNTTSSITGADPKNHKTTAGRSDPQIPEIPSGGKSSQVRAEIWAELSRLGLRKNARTDALVELEHVTPAYVRALAEKLEEQGRGGYRHTGLFVRACEQGEEIQPPADTRQRGRAVQEAVDRFLNRAC